MTQAASSIKMADVYRFLALSMRYPDPAWIDGNYLSVLYTFLEELGWQEELQALRSIFADGSAWLEPLQIEHTRLFVNAAPAVIAPPYGSVYLSDDGKLYGPSAVRAKQFYRERGYELTGEFDIPDHLTFELEFLALLARDGNTEDEERFLREHFRPWFPRFRSRVLENGRHPFYRVLVNLMDFFTREEL